MPAYKQINVGLSKEMTEKFEELKKEFFMTNDAELCRMAINRMYSDWKKEKESFREFLREELEGMIDEILDKREKK